MLIGRFSEITGLSIGALRHYDQLGLLRPAGVTSSGYRFYSDEQVSQALLIKRLRELDLPLDKIEAVVRADPTSSAELLRKHARELDRRAASYSCLSSQLLALLEDGEMLERIHEFADYRLTIQHIQRVRVVRIRGSTSVATADEFIRAALAELSETLDNDANHAGAFVVLSGLEERNKVEIVVAVPSDAPPSSRSGRVEVGQELGFDAVVAEVRSVTEPRLRIYRGLAPYLRHLGISAPGNVVEFLASTNTETVAPSVSRTAWRIETALEAPPNEEVFLRAVG
jgi:DNA-binding transcriptional MerR regulator